MKTFVIEEFKKGFVVHLAISRVLGRLGALSGTDGLETGGASVTPRARTRGVSVTGSGRERGRRRYRFDALRITARWEHIWIRLTNMKSRHIGLTFLTHLPL